MTRPIATSFHEDPLPYLDRVYPAAGDALWVPGRQLLVADLAAARAILSNPEGLYEPHSDFFQVRRGTLASRAAQVRIGGAGRALLGARLAERSSLLPGLVGKWLAPSSVWPAAGKGLVYEYLSSVLLSPDSPPALLRAIDQVVERAVVASARERPSWWRRAALRFRVGVELGRAVEHRRRHPRETPVDLLDAVVGGGTEADIPDADLAEIFLSFVFAIAGSISFALGWSVYLLGTSPGVRAQPAFVVREALRLYPVAWMLARRPARPHDVLGQAVTPRDEVVVCPYLVHRNPRYWDEPRRFRPERWAVSEERRAFIPFGWGPHSCVAGAMSLQLVEDILKVLLDRHELTVRAKDPRPQVGPALAPPRFSLALRSKAN